MSVDRYTSHVIILMHFCSRLITCNHTSWLQCQLSFTLFFSSLFYLYSVLKLFFHMDNVKTNILWVSVNCGVLFSDRIHLLYTSSVCFSWNSSHRSLSSHLHRGQCSRQRCFHFVFIRIYQRCSLCIFFRYSFIFVFLPYVMKEMHHFSRHEHALNYRISNGIEWTGLSTYVYILIGTQTKKNTSELALFSFDLELRMWFPTQIGQESVHISGQSRNHWYVSETTWKDTWMCISTYCQKNVNFFWKQKQNIEDRLS